MLSEVFIKFLFDAIYTANISKCASAVKFKTIATYLLKERDDNFIYWCIPDNVVGDDLEWLGTHERILYIVLPYERDRYKEYYRIPKQLEDAVAYFGTYWDWDVMITNRTNAVPLLKNMAMHHALNTKLSWEKPIIILEDFPMMSFKKYAGIYGSMMQDASTILGYLTAKATCISAYWEKSLIIDKARAIFSPSQITKLKESIWESTPREVHSIDLKKKEFVIDSTRPFTISFAGRMCNLHKFDKIFKLMEDNWVLKSGIRPIRGVVCTQSASTGRVKGIPDFVEIKHLGREEFWGFMKNEAHVGMIFSDEEDYPMCLIEPLLLGVPFAVIDCVWSRATLGDKYPFYFKTYQEAYHIIKLFFDDYPKYYLEYCKWGKEVFLPILLERNKTSVVKVIQGVIDDYRILTSNHNPIVGEILQLIATNLTEEPTHLDGILKRAAKSGGVELRSVQNKFTGTQASIAVAFVTDLYTYKLVITSSKFGGKESLNPGVYYKK